MIACLSQRFPAGQVALTLLAGSATVFGRYLSAEKLHDPEKAAVDALLDLAVVLIVGVVLKWLLDRRAAEAEALRVEADRAAEEDRLAAERRAEEDRLAAVRSRLLERLASNLDLVATGWVHLPDRGAANEERGSLSDALESLKLQGEVLKQMASSLRQLEADPKLIMYLHGVWSTASEYWFEGGRTQRFRYLAGLQNALEAVSVDASEATREEFIRFAGALDLAVGSSMKTNATVQEHLIGVLRGAPTHLIFLAKRPYSPPVFDPIQSIAELAGGSIDPVLQLAITADALQRHRPDDTPEGWADDVRRALDRCAGALALEITNVSTAVLRLRELIIGLQRARP